MSEKVNWSSEDGTQVALVLCFAGFLDSVSSITNGWEFTVYLTIPLFYYFKTAKLFNLYRTFKKCNIRRFFFSLSPRLQTFMRGTLNCLQGLETTTDS